MKAASLVLMLLAASAAFAGQPPPASIKLPTMADAPETPAPKAGSTSTRQKRSAGTLPAKMPYVVMYATATCPYCAKARSYMAARGIPYEERSAGNSLEFRQLGGRGVPLFVIGPEVLHGFSPAALDAAIWRAAP
ncbi:MAG TPA: glutaredoxin family protein [Pseudoduganella sp.]